ncbi:MAG: hypothetical protein CL916_09025, partial [Deltaproteobacteria bacterium]|nr:hypothetical protein [Deltaproteobacteria bacterium]
MLYLLFFGCSEKVISTYNQVPTVTITSHSQGDSINEGEEITLQAIVGDDNNQLSDLDISWHTNQRELCPAAPPLVDGTSACIATLSESENSIKVQVVDPNGEAAIEEINVNVIANQPPIVDIAQPVTDQQYYSGQLILFQAVLSDAEDDVTTLSYEWMSSLDGILPFTSEIQSDGSIEGYLSLQEGQHAITLSVEDSGGKRTAESLTISVGEANSDPECSITEPEDGHTVISGQSVLFRGLASDADTNNAFLDISWESNIDGAFNSLPPDSSGTLAFSYDGLTPGNHTITLRVTDDAGGLCTSNHILYVGTPPQVSIQSPTIGDVYAFAEPILFQATVGDQEDLPSDISLEWSSSQQGIISTTPSDSNGTALFSDASLSTGTHTIILRAEDSSGLSATASTTVHINAPPEITSLIISPSNPISTDPLEVSIVASDTDGDPITYAYAWKKDGTSTSYSTSTIPASATSVGEQWTVEVIPNDGFMDGNMATETVTIGNSEPTISTTTITPNINVYNDTIIVCTATVVDIDQTISANYVWTIGNTSYSGASLDLSTTGSMPLDIATCTASATDNEGATVDSSTSVTIDNRAPVISSVTLTPTSPSLQDVLSCAVSAIDPDGETLTYGFSWENSTTGDTYNTSSVGNTSQLDISTQSINSGDTILCSAQVEDGFSGNVQGFASAIISNAAPIFDSPVQITPSTGIYTGSLLTCSASATDLEDGTINVSYEWSIGMQSISTGSTLSIDTSNASVGDTVVCTASAVDSDGQQTQDSTSVIVENSLPTAPEVSISPSSPSEQVDDLYCSVDVDSIDADGDAILYRIEWFLNGSLWTGVTGTTTYTGDTILATDTTSGDDWYCSVTPNDGLGDGSVAISDPVSITSGNCDPNLSGTLNIETSGYCDPNPPSGWTQCSGWINTSGDDVTNNVLDGCVNSTGRLRIRIWNQATGVLEEDVMSTNADISGWRTWDYLNGSVTKNSYTNWTGSTTYFTTTGGGSACYHNWQCGIDAPCSTMTLGTGNGSSIILAPGWENEYELRINCGGSPLNDRIIAL